MSAALPGGSQSNQAHVPGRASQPIFPYIPFASSLVWNRSQAVRAPVQVHVTFSPDWFSLRMGLDLSERWHRDPVHRRDSFVAMAEALNAEFPALRLGGDPASIRGGISQIETCAFMGSIFGQKTIYGATAWPENERDLLSDEAADRLDVPDFASAPVFTDLMRQINEIERDWGAVDGELNLQGVLNTAFRLRGEHIFMDMETAPERAHHVLDVVARTMIAVADAVYQRQLRTGVIKDYFVTSHCVVNMISEEHYRRFVMPYDRMLSEHYPNFGIHNCGWKVDAYARAYAEIRPLGYLDFGIQSDLALLRRLFPATVLTVILNPDDILGKGETALRAMMERLRAGLGSCRIIAGSLDRRTRSEDVLSIFRAASGVWETPMEALVPRPHFG